MNIYLTHYRTASTNNVELLEDIVYPQRVNWFKDSYARAKLGLSYVPHKIADKVLDPALLKNLKENKLGKTAFILAAGNAHFAGINQRPYVDNQLNYVYKFLPFTLTQVYAGRTAQLFGEFFLLLLLLFLGPLPRRRTVCLILELYSASPCIFKLGIWRVKLHSRLPAPLK